MNKATQAQVAFAKKTTTRSMRSIAKDYGLVTFENFDNMVFYHFDDRSVLGVRGRARSHQTWTLPPVEPIE